MSAISDRMLINGIVSQLAVLSRKLSGERYMDEMYGIFENIRFYTEKLDKILLKNGIGSIQIMPLLVNIDAAKAEIIEISRQESPASTKLSKYMNTIIQLIGAIQQTTVKTPVIA
jgi:hypothetical protein